MRNEIKTQFKNLVFEGGGVKGIAYGGALTKLDELGIFQNIRRVAGTSAGAITATLMAIGYSAQEISDIISQTNFNDFADDDEGWLKDIYRLFIYFGWHKGDKLKQWISNHLELKLGKADLTFSELHGHCERSEAISQSKVRDLFITGSNLTTHQSEVYSHEITPTMQIRDAVRISMSIPFFFQAVITKSGDTLVDGGVIRNYPINIFDDKKYLSKHCHRKEEQSSDVVISQEQTNNYIHNPETLGFRLADKDTVEGGTQRLNITGIKSFALSLVTFMQSTAGKTHINKDDWRRTIAIDTTGVGVTEFDLGIEKIKSLRDRGFQGVTDYFVWLKMDSNC